MYVLSVVVLCLFASIPVRQLKTILAGSSQPPGQAVFNLAKRWPRRIAAWHSLYICLEPLERSLELWFRNPVKDSHAAGGQPLPAESNDNASVVYSHALQFNSHLEQ